MSQFLLAIDQGTTNSRAILFNKDLKIVASHELPLSQFFPQPGWVEQNANEMFELSLECCYAVISKAKITAGDILGIGITNQRETTIIWDKTTGKPIYPAIVWQDRRTKPFCDFMQKQIDADLLHQKTGLRFDPYFSASKIAWILDHVQNARERAEAGELLFGTVETYLLWRLTQGQSHFTDVTNASRTLIFNINTMAWDEDLLKLFNIPMALLPEIVDNTGDFGLTATGLFEQPIPICGLAGDQQSAAIGQGCFHAGDSKTTFGTGCFILLNTQQNIIHSKYNLLSTVAYRIEGKHSYCLEGSVFSAGVAVKWLRDSLKMIETANETEMLAQSLDDNHGVYLVPAFTGLGAPHWQPEARAAIFGLSRDSNRSHFARAALESVAYQLRDLLEAIALDAEIEFKSMHVDGGMVANHWLMQFVANILQMPIAKPDCIETTALGVAFLAGYHQKLFKSLEEVNQLNFVTKKFNPSISVQESDRLYQGWQEALQKLLS